MAKKGTKNQRLLAEKITKAMMIEVVKMSKTMHIVNKYKWVINNSNIDAIGDLELAGIKKYWKNAT